MGGMGNMNKIMKQAQKMQADMAKIQEELGQERVEGSSGGGMVTVTATGHGDVVRGAHRPRGSLENDVDMLRISCLPRS